ncbi:metallophosphoesterase [Candidatus Sumerlaeota bacterium]|nr:metallophosphoesterase [Candidatus Sumerlaeota bacterium]
MLRLAILGDVHFSTAGPRDSSLLFHHSPMILQTTLDQIARLPRQPDLVIQIGDLIDGSNQTVEQAQADLDRAVALFDQSSLRWTWILGNHDVASCRDRRWLLERLRRPLSYGEIVLDDSVLLLLDSACEKVYGQVGEEQLVWLEQALDLHRHRRVFVFIHHVLDWSIEDDMYIEQGRGIRALLIGSRAVKMVFVGHAHTARIETTDGYHEVATGALTAWPLMFRWIEIDADCVRVESVKVRVSPSVENEAMAAYRAHLKPWYGRIRSRDLTADLILR